MSNACKKTQAIEKVRIKLCFSILIHTDNYIKLQHKELEKVSYVIEDADQEGILAKLILALDEGSTLDEIYSKGKATQEKASKLMEFLEKINVLEKFFAEDDE